MLDIVYLSIEFGLEICEHFGVKLGVCQLEFGGAELICTCVHLQLVSNQFHHPSHNFVFNHSTLQLFGLIVEQELIKLVEDLLIRKDLNNQLLLICFGKHLKVHLFSLVEMYPGIFLAYR